MTEQTNPSYIQKYVAYEKWLIDAAKRYKEMVPEGDEPLWQTMAALLNLDCQNGSPMAFDIVDQYKDETEEKGWSRETFSQAAKNLLTKHNENYE